MLKNDEPVVPIRELLQSPVLGSKVTAPGNGGIETMFLDLSEKPATGFAVILGEEQSESVEGLVNEGGRVEGFAEAARSQVLGLPF